MRPEENENGKERGIVKVSSSSSPCSTASSSTFEAFALTCEAISSTRSKLKKIEVLSNYLRQLQSEQDLQTAVTFLSGRIFPVGAEEGEVNVGYSTIWRALEETFGKSQDDLSSYYLRHGDLGSVAEEAFERSSPQQRRFLLSSFNSSNSEKQLTLNEVVSSFREIARAKGKGSIERKILTLEALLARLKVPVEAKYLIRVLTSEMRIGLVEGLVEESIAKAFGKTLEEVRSANLVSGNIALVSTLAKRGELHLAKIEPLKPTNFMLADSAQDPQELFQKFDSMPVFSEFKYDGIRAQLHKRSCIIKIFSRNLEEVGNFFPELVSSASKLEQEDLILDGEIVPFRDGKPLSFQLLQRRLRKKERSVEDVPLMYFAFDLLFKNSVSFIERPLEERVMALESLKLEQPLTFSSRRLVNRIEEISEMFSESKSQGYEGLVVKDPNSSYTPGRRGRSWVKLKKELDTLDVVIVAAEYGHGKRAGVISDYTFAVRDGSDLKVIGKAYSGLTDLEIREMTDLLKSITEIDQGYRRIVKPKIVLEVAFDAIQKSERHDSGFALRFPRIKRIRWDKSPNEIDTLDKVRQIYESQRVRA